MPTGTIRLIEDASQAISESQRYIGSLDQIIAAIRKVDEAAIQSKLGTTSFVRDARRNPENLPVLTTSSAQIDAFNKVLRVNYDLVTKSATGQERLIATFTKYHGIEAITPEINKLNNLQEQLAVSAKAAGVAVADATGKITIRTINSQTVALRENALAWKAEAEAALAAGRGVPVFNPVTGRIAGNLSPRAVIAEADRTLAATNQIFATRRQLYRQQIELEQKLAAPLQLPPPLQAVLNKSPQTFNNLVKQGLGVSGGQFNIQTIYDQGANKNIQVYRDLEKGITTVSGSLRDESGVLTNISAKYNEHGTVIGRVGGQLSGLQNYLKQTTNDFIKLTQWTAATTILFAGLGAALHSVGLIATFDKQLQQLAITSQASNVEIKQLFSSLVDISIKTATPLEELIKSADDMALATRKANQSTAEWRASTLQLANAVGILTNIAAIDTVTATDKLAAIMKQLGLDASDLVGVLNKVTAVAGGQSVAINDIVTGLAAMAEASKAANLTLDQSIATIQVLSQVTSKSASEVAVSFKNLTGSLGGPAAIKALAEYNIAIKNTDGSLRNILDVYTEIAAKIRTGIIPEGEVQSVLRAISGGPRRLPDAAALLANVGTISSTAAISVNATNEALIANAKILDTIPAKVTQLTNAFEAFIQSKFGEAFKSVVTGFVDIATGLINILKAIPAGAYTAALQFGVLFLAVKLGGGLIRGLISGLIGLITSFGEVSVAARLASGSITGVGTAARVTGQEVQGVSVTQIAGVARRGLSTKASIGAGLTGAALGAGLSAATGGSLSQTVGGGLQGLGIGLLAFPSLDPITKIGGALALLGGTILPSLIKETKDVTEVTQEQSDAILTALGAYKKQNEAVSELQKAHTDLAQSLETAKAAEDGTAASTDKIAGLQRDYANNTLDLIDANNVLAESFKKVGDALPNYERVLLAAGAYDPAQVTKLLAKYTKLLLGPDFAKTLPPEGFVYKIPDLTPPTPTAPTLDSNITGLFNTAGEIGQVALKQYKDTQERLQAQINQGPQFIPLRSSVQATLQNSAKFDLSDLKTNYSAVTQLFSTNGKNFSAAIVPSIETLGLIDTAIQRLGDSGGDITNITAAFADYRSKVSAADLITQQLTVNLAYLEAQHQLNLLPDDAYNRAKAYTNLMLQLKEITSNLTLPQPDISTGREATGREDRGLTPEEYQAQLEAKKKAFYSYMTSQIPINAQGIPQEITRQQAINFGTGFLENQPSTTGQGTLLDELNKTGATIPTIIGLFERAGFAVTVFSESEKAAARLLSDADKQFRVDIVAGFTASTDSLTQKRADLIAQIQGGDNSQGIRNTLTQTVALIQAQAKLSASFADNGDIEAFATALKDVTGLEALGTTDANKISDALIANIVRFGLTGDAVRKVTDDYVELNTLTKTTLPNLIALSQSTNITPFANRDELRQAIVDTEARIKKLHDDIAALDAAGLGSKFGQNSDFQALTDAIKEAIVKGYEDAAAELATRTLDIQVKLLAGDYAKNPNQYNFDTQQALAISNAKQSLVSGFNTLPDTQLKAFEAQLTGLPGLQDAINLSADQLATRFGELATRLGLSATQVNELATAWLAYAAIPTIPNKLGGDIAEGTHPTPINLQEIQRQMLGSILTHPSNPTARDLYKSTLNTEQATSFDALSNTQKNAAVLEYLDKLGRGIIIDKGFWDQYNISAAKAATTNEKLAATKDANKSALSDYASRNLKIQQDIASGAYKDHPGRLAQDQAQSDAAYQSQVKLNNAVLRLDPSKLIELERHFIKIPGLENAATLSGQEFVNKIIAMGLTSGLSAAQILPLVNSILGITAAIVAIPKLTEVEIRVNTIVSEVKAGTISDQAAVDKLSNIAGSEAGGLKLYGDAKAAQDAIDVAKAAGDKKQEKVLKDILYALQHPGLPPLSGGGGGGGGGTTAKTPSLLDLNADILASEKAGLSKQPADISTIIANARKLQAQIPGAKLADAKDIVEILNGTKRIAEVRGISEELLRRSMDELSAVEKARLAFDTKADTIRRIRVGVGDFSGLVNVPFNNALGVSVGGPQGPITVNLNINGQVLTPSQMDQVANNVAAGLGRVISSGG